MPDYRDNYHGRRPPQRYDGRRPPYDDRRPPYDNRRPPYDNRRPPYDNRRPPYDDRRFDRRAREEDGYVGGHRRPRPIRPEPGEYLAGREMDRYAPSDSDWFEESRREPTRPSRALPEPMDDMVDFSDLDDFDPEDDWFAERSESYSRSSVPKAAPKAAEDRWDDDMEDSFDDGFDDDFDDDPEPPPPPRRREPRNDDPWFEEDHGSDRLPPVRAEGFGRKSAPRSRGTVIAALICAGVLAVAVAALLIVHSIRSQVMLPMESVVRSMTLEQCRELIAAHVDKRLESITCNVSVDGKPATLQLADCEVTFAGYDPDHSTKYITGTDETTGELIRTEYAVDGMFRYNKSALRAFFDGLLDGDSVPVVDPHFEIDYEAGKMTVFSGSDGWGVDLRQFLSQLNSALMATPGDTVSLTCTSGAVTAQPLSAEEIHKQAIAEPADAYTTTDAAGNTVYHSEINGVEFSRSDLEQLLASGGTQWELPVKVTFPETNLKDIKKYTFPDLLASYYTYYNNGNKGRSSNLALAAEHINTTILEPGEQFSFNDVVGERTPANGFKIATVYQGEGTAEDYGGGICQTSSTLYYTCILANLQIDERSNHMYTVTYMQSAEGRRTVYGNDATVNWGYTDYKFTNNKEYPIRIDIVAKDGILTCEIRGTADGSTADFQYEVIETTPYKIKYLPDNGSPDQDGHTGYWVNVYRVIYQDGVRVDRVLESKNTYQPMNQIYYTNDLPAGFEYNVEYDKDYTPPTGDETTTTSAETQATEPVVTE